MLIIRRVDILLLLFYVHMIGVVVAVVRAVVMLPQPLFFMAIK